MVSTAAPSSKRFPGPGGPGWRFSWGQTSFWVTLLLTTLARERTFQNMIDLHFCYWCIVVLWQGCSCLCPFVPPGEDVSMSLQCFSECFFHSIFFHCTWPSGVNIQKLSHECPFMRTVWILRNSSQWQFPEDTNLHFFLTIIFFIIRDKARAEGNI